MTGRAVADHLALMARSGLMTHVAELDPPVTAASMEQFRADAAAQASNVMALSSGRVAVCLAPNARRLETSVPHRLTPIGAGKPIAGEGQAAVAAPTDLPQPQAPRRILPPSMRRAEAERPGLPREMTGGMTGGVVSAPPQPRAAETPAIAAAAAPLGTTLAPLPLPAPAGGADRMAAPDPALSSEASASPALDRLEQRLDMLDQRLGAQRQEVAAALREAEERLAARLDAQVAPLSTRIADALATGVSHLAEQIARARAEADAAAHTREGRARARADALESRLTEALTLADAERTGGLAVLQDMLQDLALAQAEQEARMGEGLATLRLGLRAMNDRLGDVSAQLADAPALRAAPAGHPASDEGRVAVLNSGRPAIAAPVPADPSTHILSDVAREHRLRAALGALLDELGQAAAGPGTHHAPSYSPPRRAGSEER